ncbi:addiction module protein [Aliarcobacter cryaerophilus]|uniref:addiction module protein n=1 Tax=Aliarcobacter cryaerophilus TaxID=28198 RepID=UPI0021B1B816|nr:addiction module protein [Aliarcobacter cryaerophilus]MCT7491873.1 addiction module protein [Aliarcobacter cryaerophilus]MCT7498328.1 addiction module protein [Aliarcobacter cryaerophilus]MCT7532382.1 addiction module protein [Aliarcobacter cryaerophilus]MCT7542697.1 addiction module protein [Aliarcobacter cryaerophilus]
MGIDEIKNLDINQRLNLIDMIWQTLENQEKDIESPTWHKDILEKRLEKIEKNDVKYISLDELKRLCI